MINQRVARPRRKRGTLHLDAGAEIADIVFLIGADEIDMVLFHQIGKQPVIFKFQRIFNDVFAVLVKIQNRRVRPFSIRLPYASLLFVRAAKQFVSRFANGVRHLPALKSSSQEMSSSKANVGRS